MPNRRNNYTPQFHPVVGDMNRGIQQGVLYGKLNVGVKEIEVEPDKEKDIVLVLNGNSDDAMVFDGNVNTGK